MLGYAWVQRSTRTRTFELVMLGEVLLPRLLLAAALVLGGMWLGRARGAVRSGR